MCRVPGTFSAATTTPAPAVPRVQPTAVPPGNPQALGGGSATGPAEAILYLAEDHERIALGLNDVVVRRRIGQRAIRRIPASAGLRPAPRRASPTWRQFLISQASGVLSSVGYLAWLDDHSHRPVRWHAAWLWPGVSQLAVPGPEQLCQGG